MMLTPEQEQLLENNKALVNHALKCLNIPYTSIDYKDKESVGLFGLCKAIKTYDESKGTTFSTYAIKCIKNEIFMAMRADKKYSKDISISTVLKQDKEGNKFTFEDILVDYNQNVEENIFNRETYARLLSHTLNFLLPKQQSTILYWLGGKNQRQISKLMNVSQSYVSKLLRSSMNFLKELEKNSISQEKKKISVSFQNNIFKISFLIDDVLKFADVFSKSLYKLELQEGEKSSENLSALPRFKVNFTNTRAIFLLPGTSESFLFLSVFVQEFNSYTQPKYKKVETKSNFDRIKEFLSSFSGEFSIETIQDYFGDTIELEAIKNVLQIMKLKKQICTLENGNYSLLVKHT